MRKQSCLSTEEIDTAYPRKTVQIHNDNTKNAVPVEAVLAGFEGNGSAANLSLFVVADVDVLESKCAVQAAPNASWLEHPSYVNFYFSRNHLFDSSKVSPSWQQITFGIC